MSIALKTVLTILAVALPLTITSFAEKEPLPLRLKKLGFTFHAKDNHLPKKRDVTAREACEIFEFRMEDLRMPAGKSGDEGVRTVEHRGYIVYLHSKPALSRNETWKPETNCDVEVNFRAKAKEPRSWEGNPMGDRLKKLGFTPDPQMPEVLSKGKVTVRFMSEIFAFKLDELDYVRNQSRDQNDRKAMTEDYYIILRSNPVVEQSEDWTLDTKADVSVQLWTDQEKEWNKWRKKGFNP